ncbi:MAG: biopolymer transporter ExbD [Verrucomicrobiota bacterium]
MGRFRSASEDDPDEAVDISPLIDCVFILLIFFIVTTTFVDESGFGADRPTSTPSSAESDSEDEPVIFKVMADGRIFESDLKIPFSSIRPIVANKLAKDNEAKIVVMAAPDASFGAAARIVDEVRLAGGKPVFADLR